MIQNSQQKAIYNIIKIIDKAKETREETEYINDFNTIDKMINKIIPYDSSKVEEIREKYNEEFKYLLTLEMTTRPSQRSNVTNSIEQDLLSVRHSLIRVGVKRTLEKIGKKMLEEKLIDNDNTNLYNNFSKLYFEDLNK